MDDTNYELFSVNSAAFIATSASNRFSNSALYFNKRASTPTTNTLLPQLAVFRFLFKNTSTRSSPTWTSLGVSETTKLVSATSEQ